MTSVSLSTDPKPERFGDGPVEKDGDDRALLALDTVATTTWWAPRVSEALDLNRCPADADAPRRLRFADAGDDVTQARWIDGERMIALERYAREPYLIEAVGGQTQRHRAAHIQRSSLEEYRLYEIDGEYRSAPPRRGAALA